LKREEQNPPIFRQKYCTTVQTTNRSNSHVRDPNFNKKRFLVHGKIYYIWEIITDGKTFLVKKCFSGTEAENQTG